MARHPATILATAKTYIYRMARRSTRPARRASEPDEYDDNGFPLLQEAYIGTSKGWEVLPKQLNYHL